MKKKNLVSGLEGFIHRLLRPSYKSRMQVGYTFFKKYFIQFFGWMGFLRIIFYVSKTVEIEANSTILL